MFRIVLIILICGCVLISGCAKKFAGDDAKMMQSAKLIAQAINDYHSDYAQWPEKIEQASECLPAGTPWPVNPYDGKPIRDTGSPDFDEATSVGMVYYQRTFRNEVQTNFLLHVYGTNGELGVISLASLGKKKK